MGNCGKIIDGSIAYIEPGGGGQSTPRTHATHSHLFVVVAGEVVIRTESEDIVLRSNESYMVEGSVKHSVWNNLDTTAVMVGDLCYSRPKHPVGRA